MRNTFVLTCCLTLTIATASWAAKPEGRGPKKDTAEEVYGGYYCFELRDDIATDAILSDGSTYCGEKRGQISVYVNGSRLVIATYLRGRSMWLDFSQATPDGTHAVPPSGLYEVAIQMSLRDTEGGQPSNCGCWLDFYCEELDMFYRVNWNRNTSPLYVIPFDSNDNSVLDSYYVEATSDVEPSLQIVEAWGSSSTTAIPVGTLRMPFAAQFWDREIE